MHLKVLRYSLALSRYLLSRFLSSQSVHKLWQLDDGMADDATHAAERANLKRTLLRINTKNSYTKICDGFCVFTEVKR